jgi:hypothetical protein
VSVASVSTGNEGAGSGRLLFVLNCIELVVNWYSDPLRRQSWTIDACRGVRRTFDARESAEPLSIVGGAALSLAVLELASRRSRDSIQYWIAFEIAENSLTSHLDPRTLL